MLRILLLAAALPFAVLTGCSGDDCTGGPNTSVLKDEDLTGNTISSAQPWCGNQFIDNTVSLHLKYIITGDTQTNPLHYNWTLPPGSSFISGEKTPFPVVRLGKTSGDITAEVENRCGKSTQARRHLDVIASRALSTLPDFPGTRRLFAGGFALAGLGYAVGGVSFTSDAEKYKDVWRFDPATLLWTQVADAPEAGRAFGAALTDRALVLINGSLYAFTPPGAWSKLGTAPFTGYPTFVAAAGGKIFFGSTEVVGVNTLGTAWQFDPATAAWTKINPTGLGPERLDGFGLGGTLYLGGGCINCGFDNRTPLANWFAFDVASGTLGASPAFQYAGLSFEAWTWSDAVLLWNENDFALFTPAAGVTPYKVNPAMTCPYGGTFTGPIGRSTFAIGDRAYRSMGLSLDQVGYGVEAFTR